MFYSLLHLPPDPISNSLSHWLIRSGRPYFLLVQIYQHRTCLTVIFLDDAMLECSLLGHAVRASAVDYGMF